MPFSKHNRLVRFGTVSVCETVYAPRAKLPSHEHRASYLSFVVAGDYTESIGLRSVRCPTNRVRFHAPGEVHADEFGQEGAVCLNIELDDCWHEGLRGLHLYDPADMIVAEDATWLALQVRRQFVAAEEDWASLDVEELTATIIDRCVGAREEARASASHPGIRRAADFMRANAGVRFSLTDVAKAAELHPTHLARIFRKTMGSTVGAYARRARIIHAQDILRSGTSESLSRIALEAGFSDHAHFTRVFGRTIGVSPSEFRQAARETACVIKRVSRLQLRMTERT